MLESDQKNNQVYFNVATSAIMKVFLVIIGFWFLYVIRDILVIVFVSVVFAALLDPFADWFAKRYIPRAITVLVLYLILFGLAALAVIMLIPPIVTESRDLSVQLGDLLHRLTTELIRLQLIPEDGFLTHMQNIFSAQVGLGNAWTGIFNTITGFFGGIISFFTILVLTFYLVVEESALRKMLKVILPTKYHVDIANVTNKAQKKVGDWLKGKIILSLIVAGLVYVALFFAGMHYALVLALIAGLTEFIPYVGPVLGALPAIFLALGDSPLRALAVVALYTAIQHFENLILVPKIMQKTVGLNPVISIVALVAGFKVGGVLGALVALPVVVSLDVVFREFIDKSRTL